MTTENTSFLPEGFRTRMREFLGGEVDAFENSFHREPRRALRVNTRRVSAREFYEQNRQCFGLSPVPWAGAGFYYRTEGECRPGKHPYHEAGLYYIQEPSAMAAAAMLCDGGVLVYSTCTFAPEENEGTVARFLLRHPDFHTARIPEALRFAGFDSGRPEFLKASVYDRELAPEGMTPAIEEELCRAIRLWPHRLEGEGHFVCLLQREGERSARFCADRMQTADTEAVKLWGAFADTSLRGGRTLFPGERMIAFGGELYLMPEAFSMQGLKVLRPGLDLGAVKKGRFEPSHSLALALQPLGASAALEAEMDSAGPEVLRYLRGESLTEASTRVCMGVSPGRESLMEASTRVSMYVSPDALQEVLQGVARGWTLMKTDGFALGWGKASGGVIKNHYPKGLRWMS